MNFQLIKPIGANFHIHTISYNEELFAQLKIAFNKYDTRLTRESALFALKVLFVERRPVLVLLMAMMSKQNWVLLWMLPSKEALLTQKVDIANIEQRTQNSYLFIKGIVFVRTMAFFESLCRCRGLSKCSAAPRFPRPNMMNHMRLAKETIRSLSSLPLRRVESLATDTSSNKMSHQRKPLVKENITQKVSRRTSPASLTYTGNVTMPVTSKLKIVTPQEDPPCGIWPVYRLMVSTT